MNSKSNLKKIRLVFLSLFLINIGILIFLTVTCKKSIGLGEGLGAELFFLQQKQIALYNIFGFMVLLLASLVIYYLSQNQKPFWLTNLTFIFFAGYHGFKLTPQYYAHNTNLPVEQSGMQIMTLFTVFYIAGAILVSAIGYITAKNITARNLKP